MKYADRSVHLHMHTNVPLLIQKWDDDTNQTDNSLQGCGKCVCM